MGTRCLRTAQHIQLPKQRIQITAETRVLHIYRLAANGCTYTFGQIEILLCSRVDDDVKAQYDGYKHLGKYCLAQIVGNFEIYALSWDDIFLSYQRRYKFIINKLRDDYEAYCSKRLETDIVDRAYVDECIKALTSMNLA